MTRTSTFNLFASVVIACLVSVTIAAKGIGLDPGPAVKATKGEVWPKPQQQVYSQTFMMVRPSAFTFQVIKHDCDILQDAIQRYSKIVKSQEKKRRMASDDAQRGTASNSNFAGYLETIKINLLNPCETLPHVDMDEKYELNVNSQPREAVLVSDSIWGVLRGLETFSQLLYASDSSALMINNTVIKDFPRFRHRGLLLDTSRHYIPLKIIYKILDAMSMNKFNVFHWHIVDDHSFPYQSTTYPRLCEYGAYTSKHVYTQEDVRNVLKYATFRGIRVIPEFDTPGHTRSWGEGYPELLTKCYSKNGWDGSLGPMNPIVNSTYTFINSLLNEIQKVFPDKYFHVGGDEVEYACWMSNPDLTNYVIQNKITFKDLEELYIKRVINLVKSKSLRAIVWQEVFDNGLNVPKDTIVHVWKVRNYPEEVQFVTSMGYTALLSSPWYLDHIGGGGDWIKYYNVDPLAFNGTSEQKNRVIGGEACMWSEHVDATNVLTRIWPRACAAAERLWSAENVKSYQIAAPRLEEQVCRLNMRGIPTQPANGPGFCPFVNF